MSKELHIQADGDSKEKIHVNASKSSSFGWLIGYKTPLDPESVNNKTIYVTDESQNRINCIVRYNIEKQAINIKPISAYRDNTYYYLHITKEIRGANRTRIDEEATVKFLLKDKRMTNVQVLPGYVDGSVGGGREPPEENAATHHTVDENAEHMKHKNLMRLPTMAYYIIGWPIMIAVFLMLFEISWMVIAILAVATVFVFPLVFIPHHLRIKNSIMKVNIRIDRFNTGVDFFNAGQYGQAYEIFTELGVGCGKQARKAKKYLDNTRR